MTKSDPCDDCDIDANSADPPVDADSGIGGEGNLPYGSTVVSAVHASLAAACQNIQDAMGPLENPSVKEGLQAILSALQEQQAALEGLHASNYPGQPALKDESGDDSQDDDSMKAFLASGQIASLQMLGLGARIKGIIGARNLTPNQRRILTGVSQRLAKLVAQSKSVESENNQAKIMTLQQSIRELTNLLLGLAK